ncbi:hypothetical protein [Aureimonas pseudogalii]|uniref:Uncharacterized protein n=1 Tax=Aureimonas pseudogalii TaxID=1744844 RepID=A0A7W6H402_9HYPH|nr:hypothetical protein [Aureimonas pseudogalii]MBB3997607.1 hypothetical protein [Aureimonas pseudogalii]
MIRSRPPHALREPLRLVRSIPDAALARLPAASEAVRQAAERRLRRVRMALEDSVAAIRLPRRVSGPVPERILP